MAAGCDAQRVAVGPICRAGIVSVREPIPAALSDVQNTPKKYFEKYKMKYSDKSILKIQNKIVF